MIDIVVIGNDSGIKQLIEREEIRVSVISDEIQALTAAKELTPNIFFLSYDVRQDQTPEYVFLLKQASQTSKVVLIGQNVADETVIDCLVKGAQGYTNATEEMPKLLEKMINALMAGEVWISRRLTAKILAQLRVSLS